MIAGTRDLTEIERDALTELVNIGVGRAATSLRKMVGKQILLAVPSVELVTRADAASLLGERESSDLVAVRQDFTGSFSGRALLIFPQLNSLELVRVVAGETLSAQEILDIQHEALAETGNIILNGCLGSVANMLQRTLTMSLPDVIRGDSQVLFEVGGGTAADSVVVFLYINFAVRERNIRGYIAMLMNLESLESLKLLIHDFIARVTGGGLEPLVPDGEA